MTFAACGWTFVFANRMGGMATILVVVTDEGPDDRLLSAAKRHVTGTDDHVLLYRIIDEHEYQHDVERSAMSGHRTEDRDDLQAAETARLEDLGSDAFGEAVSWDALVEFGTVPDDVLRVADERGCEHVFVTGRKRSPSGKALFGDDAQRIILNFDGPVTITTA